VGSDSTAARHKRALVHSTGQCVVRS
jgi:hypothetical protein